MPKQVQAEVANIGEETKTESEEKAEMLKQVKTEVAKICLGVARYICQHLESKPQTQTAKTLADKATQGTVHETEYSFL